MKQNKILKSVWSLLLVIALVLPVFGYANTITVYAATKKQTAIQNMKDIQVLDPLYVKKGKKLFIEISYPYDRHVSPTMKGYGEQEIKSISYKVKDTKIATVSKKGSKDGYITGKRKGWTKVVITFKDIYGYTYSYTANVFVNISQSDAFKMQHPEYFE